MSITLPKIVQKKKRLGRGIGRGGAKSGRGQKGQKSRAGYSRKGGFEGGQTPLYMRLPKLSGAKQFPGSQVVGHISVTTNQLNQFGDTDIVGPGVLRKAGLLANRRQTVKLLAGGKLAKKLTVRVHAASASAVKEVESSGGKVEIIQK